MKNKRYVARLLVALAVVQVLLVLVSWLIAAAWPTSSVHSLLGSEGIRWFFGRFVENLNQPLLVWILLANIALGAMRASGLWQSLCLLFSGGRLMYRERFAVWVVAILLVAIVAVMLLLSLAPGTVLLSATGSVWPSSLSRSLVPVCCFAMSLCSVVYGVVSGGMRSLTDVFDSLSVGVGSLGGWLLAYVIIVQLYFSLKFVFFSMP